MYNFCILLGILAICYKQIHGNDLEYTDGYIHVQLPATDDQRPLNNIIRDGIYSTSTTEPISSNPERTHREITNSFTTETTPLDAQQNMDTLPHCDPRMIILNRDFRRLLLEYRKNFQCEQCIIN